MASRPANPPRRYGFTREEELAMTRAKRRLLERVNKITMPIPMDEKPRAQRRWIVLDMDNVLCSLRNSNLLYEAVSGATVGEDLRLDIAKFTELLRRRNPWSFCELHAVYAQTNPAIASVFQDFGWTLSRANTPHGASRRDMIRRAIRLGIERTSRDNLAVVTTLVLASGDGDIITSNQSECGRVDTLFSTSPALRVEIYSWLHSLHNAFFDLQRRFPSQVRVHALNDSVAEVVTTANEIPAAPFRPRSLGSKYDSDRYSMLHKVSRASASTPAVGSQHVRSSHANRPLPLSKNLASSSTDDALIASIVIVAITFIAGSLWFYSVVFPHISTP